MVFEDGNVFMIFLLFFKNNLIQVEQVYMEIYQFEVMSWNNWQVNGLNVCVVQGCQVDEQNQQVINILFYFIEYEGWVYQLLGMVYQQQYGNYESSFLCMMNGFDCLMDVFRINVQLECIKIVKVLCIINLCSLLISNGILNDCLEEFVILNGMEFNMQVESGIFFKVVDKVRN